ncbi:MAG: DUF1972 domain-containing protein [Bacteroidales bacterium]|nr:DUF1972 domain-containing protein [Bacteroidales bacterium]MDD4671427.1 DUF1972 domain-containing protein [Bacteroidales bacterium]MDY0347538.1 DUF1972 domain-containing protein [Tenuifilaceae bacterium]
MKIAIIGTKGIPNCYGGFEAFAEHLSQGLLLQGFSVVVYQPVASNTNFEPFRGVHRLGVRVPSFLPSNISRVFYNLYSLRLVRQTMPDVAICCGHSPALFFPFFSKAITQKIIVNLDGLEWKRAKWGAFARLLLKLTERLAVKYSGALIADSVAIKNYVSRTYQKQANFIPYGASDLELKPDHQILAALGVEQQDFVLLIARVEPENNVEMAIISAINACKTLVIVGALTTPYAKKLTKRYAHCSTIIFANSIYNYRQLTALRLACNVYVHGHSVGGTNPSLLDAMDAGCLIIANDNEFNRETLANGGFYFSSVETLQNQIERAWDSPKSVRANLQRVNNDRIASSYTWDAVTKKYVDLIAGVAENLSKL